MNKLFFALLALYAIQSANAVTPEEVKEAQRLIELKIYTTKHIAALVRRVVNTRYDEFITLSRRVWYAFQRDIEAHLDQPECTENATLTLLELENKVINARKDRCMIIENNEMEEVELDYLNDSLNEMKNAEETCNKPEVDYHKCMQEIINNSKDVSDEVMKTVRLYPALMMSTFQTCLLIEQYADKMLARTDEARKIILDCIENNN